MRRGFTLIELLVVIAIIAVLSSIVLIGLNGSQNVSHDDRRISDLNQAESDLETYFSECGFYPGPAQVSGSCSIPFNTPPTADTWALMTSALEGSSALRISTVPNDPVKGRTYYYGTNSDGSSYIIGAQMDSSSSAVFKNYVPPPDLASYNAQGLSSCKAPFYCEEFLFSGGSESTYNCVSNKCVAVVGNGGQFTSKASCSAVCGVVAGYPPTITSLTEETLTVTVPFSYNITATNCSPICNYGATGLPSWLTFNASKGLLSGTPKVAGTYPMTITASNGTATSSQTLTLTVNNVDAPSLNDLAVSVDEKAAFDYTIDADNCDVAPCTYTATDLPTWVVFDGVQTLSGTAPSASGTYTAKLSASNAGGTDTETLTISVVSSTGSIGGGNASGSPLFGVNINTVKTTQSPSVTFGLLRFWDSPPYQWGTMEVSPGCGANASSPTNCSYSSNDMNGFDTYMQTIGKDKEVIYTMARTPTFISQFPNDTACNYQTTGAGQCDMPIDLDTSGDGSNAAWRDWYAWFMYRVNTSSYLSSHAHLRYWEVWNEPDTQAFCGNNVVANPNDLCPFNDLMRLTEDAECLLLGHLADGSTVEDFKDGSSNDTCSQVLSSVGLSTAIDPSAIVISPSYHPKGTSSMNDFQNYLYCNKNSPPFCSYAAVNAGPKTLMVANMHMKPGQDCVDNTADNNCTIATDFETTYSTYINNLLATFQPAEKSKVLAGTIPIWDDELDYSSKGFGDGDVYEKNPDLQESYVARVFIYGLSLGVTGNAWYSWDKVQNGSTNQTAWDTTYKWLVGSDAHGGFCTQSGNIFTCNLKSSAGKSEQIVWDASQGCTTAGVCSTSNYTPPAGYTTYSDIMGDPPTNISGGTVKIGVKPLLLQ